MNTNFSTATRGKLHAPHIVPRWELIPCLLLKVWTNFPPALQEEFSLSSREVRGTLCFLSQVEWTWEALTQKKARFLYTGLNSASSFISQDEGMSESPVEVLEKAIVLRLICSCVSHPFDTSRGTRNSMLPKVTMPDSSWKWIGVPISLCQIESVPRSPSSPPEASVLFFQA